MRFWMRTACSMYMLVFASCLDEAEAIPVHELIVSGDSAIELKPGESALIAVQALDDEGRGTNGAEVTFVVSDDARLTVDGPDGGTHELTVVTAFRRVEGVSADGMASTHLRALEAAPVGDAVVIAVVKQPTEPSASITARLSAHVTEASNDNDAGVSP
ncbi:MAG TPA: hypothetical protein VJV78_39305 [Polyangiales bacterium]|nr:hypothetical protein [Polyangiales bacterium]